MQTLEADFAETINPVASLGFIGLATDRAGHFDFCDFVAPFDGVAVHATKIPFVDVATPKTLAAMADGLRASAGMLVPGQPLQSISFSCTSGTIAIGPAKVRSMINETRPDSEVVTPIGAAVQALRQLDCRNVSVLMPYLVETANIVVHHLENSGFELDRVATFDLPGDPEMNRITPDSIIEAAISVCDPDSDALFISCTGMRTFPVIDRLEQKLGKPVVTSNQALAWAALRAAGVNETSAEMGTVFSSL